MEEWKKNAHLLNDKLLYVTCEEKCFIISDGNLPTMAHLDSTQEEADTRLLLHAHDASVNYYNIVIQTPDTDVLILAIAMWVAETKFYVKTGKHHKLKPTDVEKVVDGIDYNNKADVSEALLGLHAFTSTFHGRGKVKAFRLMLKHDFVSTFKSLSQKAGKFHKSCLKNYRYLFGKFLV